MDTPTQRLKSLSILVVDDMHDTAESLATVLELNGFAAKAVTSGEEALAFCATTPPDVLFLDLRMPGIDGWEVAQRLHEQPAGKHPLVVAVTGCSGEEDQRRADAAGIKLLLVKPVEPAVLVGILRRFQRVLS